MRFTLIICVTLILCSCNEPRQNTSPTKRETEKATKFIPLDKTLEFQSLMDSIWVEENFNKKNNLLQEVTFEDSPLLGHTVNITGTLFEMKYEYIELLTNTVNKNQTNHTVLAKCFVTNKFKEAPWPDMEVKVSGRLNKLIVKFTKNNSLLVYYELIDAVIIEGVIDN